MTPTLSHFRKAILIYAGHRGLDAKGQNELIDQVVGRRVAMVSTTAPPSKAFPRRSWLDLETSARKAVDDWQADLTEPHTVRAMVSLLCLAAKRHPGPMGLEARWYRNGADTAWVIACDGLSLVFCLEAPERHHGWTPLVAPDVASELDMAKALGMALVRVVEANYSPEVAHVQP